MPADRDARIRERAYHIWIEEGRVHGKEHEHWDRAEREIAAEDANAEVDGAVTSGSAEPSASVGSVSPSARRPHARPTSKPDAPAAESDMPPARRRQREPSDAGC